MTATTFRLFFAARDAFNNHFDGCRTCGIGGRLCADGGRLHTDYVARKTTIETGR